MDNPTPWRMTMIYSAEPDAFEWKLAKVQPTPNLAVENAAKHAKYLPYQLLA
jgi:hypothetical protein